MPKKGEILHKDRLGEKHNTKEGYEIEIVEYFNSMNCTIRINDKNKAVIKDVEYKRVKNKSIKNPFHPRIYNRGFIGQGKLKSEVNGKATKHYYVWRGMFERCYDKNYQMQKRTYIGCSVSILWYNFQKFGEWFEENYKEGFVLDKDILVKGNKIYSPETCCFVPAEINIIFTSRKQCRGVYPIGVAFNKSKQKFEASLSVNGKGTYLGTYNTPEEAFQAYKTAKENYIKEVADKWKDQIDPKVYQAMYNYQVEITD